MHIRIERNLKKEKGMRLRNALTKEAKLFLNNLPESYKSQIIADFNKYLISQEPDRNLGREVKALSSFNSVLLHLPLGNWKLTEKIYDNDYSGNFFDKYIVGCISGRATNNRFTTVVSSVSRIIQENRCKTIWSLGSGIGSDIIQIYKKNPEMSGQVVSKSIDFDEDAMIYGRELARQNNLSQSFSFVCGDFTKTRNLAELNGVKPDLVLMIGIICPLTPERSTRLLRLLRRSFKKGTILIVSSTVDRMLRDDPFSCYLVDLVMGWHLIFKTESQFKKLVEDAGYVWEGMFTDYYGYHGMAICRVP